MHIAKRKPEGVEKLAYAHSEAAKMLSISERKLAQLVEEEKIRRAKAGNKNLFPREELLRFLNENMV